MSAPFTADPDLVRAACAVLDREWGSYGYRVGILPSGPGAVQLYVQHSDGSEFVITYRDSGQWSHRSFREHRTVTA